MPHHRRALQRVSRRGSEAPIHFKHLGEERHVGGRGRLGVLHQGPRCVRREAGDAVEHTGTSLSRSVAHALDSLWIAFDEGGVQFTHGNFTPRALL